MTTSSEILGALRACSLPLEALAAFAAIAEGEGAPSFRTLYSGGTLLAADANVVIDPVTRLRMWTGSLDAFPPWPGATTDHDYSTAAGAVQFTRTTWQTEVIKLAGAATDFAPATQIANFWLFAQERFRSRSGGLDLLTDLKAGGAALKLINTYLGGTWPGGADVNFPARYAANLAALQTAPPPPPPPPPDIETITFSGRDNAGNAWSGTLSRTHSALIGAVAGAVGMAAATLSPPAATSPPAPIAALGEAQLRLPPAQASLGREAEVPPAPGTALADPGSTAANRLAADGPGVLTEFERCYALFTPSRRS